ncbi:hypothetical protein D9757_014946 [Collybiopsis confluens]|uniref:Uncharacterized protein n=1 Tax=Collybiopsis confluens TaxID=2823264 RepID=A0A8H5CSK1_9AGAR|nr:hypothetical protein D9757_014946 [Collybiopsis confluens]
MVLSGMAHQRNNQLLDNYGRLLGTVSYSNGYGSDFVHRGREIVQSGSVPNPVEMVHFGNLNFSDNDEKHGRSCDDNSLCGHAAQLFVPIVATQRSVLMKTLEPLVDIWLSVFTLNGRSSLREKETVVKLYSSTTAGRFVGTNSSNMGLENTHAQVSYQYQAQDHTTLSDPSSPIIMTLKKGK